MPVPPWQRSVRDLWPKRCDSHDYDCKECGYEMSTQNVNIPDVGYCAYCDAYHVIECIHCNELERYDMCLQVDESGAMNDA